MTDRDIERLRGAFYSISFEEIHSLDMANFPWLPRLSGLRLLAGVDAICDALKATQDPNERIRRVAALYAWLVPRGLFRSWVLYRLYRNLEGVAPKNIMSMLDAAVRSRGCSSASATVDTDGTVCLAIMTRHVARETLEHRLLCICLRMGLPFVAIHAPGGILDEADLSEALALVLGDPGERTRGRYEDLRSAFSAASRSTGKWQGDIERQVSA